MKAVVQEAIMGLAKSLPTILFISLVLISNFSLFPIPRAVKP